MMLLVVYLSVTMGSNVVALSCRCIMHHSKTACTTVSECHHDCCEKHTAEPRYRGERCCHHSHSTEVELYTQTRSMEDTDMRLVSMAALVVSPCCLGECSHNTVDYEYGEYPTPPLLGAFCTQPSLRAPPALV